MNDPHRGVVEVDAVFLSAADEPPQDTRCQVIVEDALTLDVEGVGFYTLMWTPASASPAAQAFTLEDGVLGDVEDPEALSLALGFARTEGLIRNLTDIRALSLCPDDPRVVRVQLRNPTSVHIERRNVVINSSCGICGPREILEENALGLEAVATSLYLDDQQLPILLAVMRDGQYVFDETGGSHAAAVFDAAGVLATAEDLGRHNALDKAIGRVLIEGRTLTGCGLLLSSRLSLEMVLKAVRAGIEIVLAVSAPTSLAIQVAERFNVTLCGFVRDGRATVFTHPERLTRCKTGAKPG
jgi:FdhD protein